jgi:hypothetical protein
MSELLQTDSRTAIRVVHPDQFSADDSAARLRQLNLPILHRASCSLN